MRVLRGNGRVVNRYWTDYRFIVTLSFLRTAEEIARISGGYASMIIEIRISTITGCLCNNILYLNKSGDSASLGQPEHVTDLILNFPFY